MSQVSKIASDATSSIVGMLYQMSVALEHAFLLEEGQKIWIEKCGDVSVDQAVQVETKHHADALTDEHVNFWKTIKNWLDPNFDRASFRCLVLCTTQQIGVNSKLGEWNESDTYRRLTILKEISDAAEQRHAKLLEITSGKKPSQVLLLQRDVLQSANASKLEEVLSKFVIVANHPGVVDLRKRIFDRFGKAILRAKKDAFLDDLLGYMLSPVAVQNGWEITFQGFCDKVKDVTEQYRRDTVIFPSVVSEPSSHDVDLKKDKLFVKKLHEIEYPDVVPEAIKNYMYAHSVVIEEFRSYGVHPETYNVYQGNLKKHHQTQYRMLFRSAAPDPLKASKDFYDQITGAHPLQFSTFHQTPIEFRNGVLHMLADDERGDLHWRLW